MIQMMIMAACGWYLLTPPILHIGGGMRYDVKRPYSEWDQSGAYDTAKECEDARHSIDRDGTASVVRWANLLESAQEALKQPNLSAKDRAAQENLRDFAFGNLGQRCISSDVL